MKPTGASCHHHCMFYREAVPGPKMEERGKSMVEWQVESSMGNRTGPGCQHGVHVQLSGAL